ncbi:MAG: 50S ribosomal protein L4 [bacterium]|nr:50S ribosomal protein L4 [bacterium]
MAVIKKTTEKEKIIKVKKTVHEKSTSIKVIAIKVKKAVAPKTTGEFLMKVFDIFGKEEKSLELPKEIFDIKTDLKLISQYIRVFLTNQRQGNASTKTRGEVMGSTRKIYRQKGTGNARHGDIKAPIFVGGGIVGGPRTHDYNLKMNKKQKQIAFYSALTLKFKEQNIFGLQLGTIKDLKTKIIAQFLKTVKADNGSVIFVLPKLERNNFVLSARNLKKVSLCDVSTLNPYEIVKTNKLFFVDDALLIMSKKFSKT